VVPLFVNALRDVRTRFRSPTPRCGRRSHRTSAARPARTAFRGRNRRRNAPSCRDH